MHMTEPEPNNLCTRVQAHDESTQDMFMDATSFKQQLCGTAWITSTATQNLMFKDSPGAISQEVCASTPSQYARERRRGSRSHHDPNLSSKVPLTHAYNFLMLIALKVRMEQSGSGMYQH